MTTLFPPIPNCGGAYVLIDGHWVRERVAEPVALETPADAGESADAEPPESIPTPRRGRR